MKKTRGQAAKVREHIFNDSVRQTDTLISKVASKCGRNLRTLLEQLPGVEEAAPRT